MKLLLNLSHRTAIKLVVIFYLFWGLVIHPSVIFAQTISSDTQSAVVQETEKT